MRLSKEDERCGAESNSITMQRMLLRRYADEHFTNYDLLEFLDDGYTGTNLKRPGMQEMLELVKESKLDCIMVKDFSRFARDYIELGSYLEQIFPFMGVRFISVNDDYDSSDYQGSPADIDVDFKNLLYDLYSKDLSQKVRSSLAARKEKGAYVSANSPFGYEKDPKDRHGLLIEADEAAIVRKIFSLALEGYSAARIARLFNEMGIKTPIEFKIEKGKTRRVPKGGRFLWSSSTICAVLRNEVYIGNIVQKKTTKEFVGGKNRLNPREERLIIEHHHEPIIAEEVFEKIHEGRRGKRPQKFRPTHPLVGKLVCGCCKRNLGYRGGQAPYFACRNRFSSALGGCVGRVSTAFLEQYLSTMIQEKIEAGGKQEKWRQESVSRLDAEIKEKKARLQKVSSRSVKLKYQKLEQYENFALGNTEAFQFDEEAAKAVEMESENLKNSIAQMEGERDRMLCGIDQGGFASGFPVLTREMLDCCIEKIEVFDEQHIELVWKEI